MEELFEDYILSNYADQSDTIFGIINYMVDLREDVPFNSYLQYVPELSYSEEDTGETLTLIEFLREHMRETLTMYGVTTEERLRITAYWNMLLAIDELDNEEFRQHVMPLIESEDDRVEIFCRVLGAYNNQGAAMHYDEVFEVDDKLIQHMKRLHNIEEPVSEDTLELLPLFMKLRSKPKVPTELEAAYRRGLKTGLSEEFYKLITSPTESQLSENLIGTCLLAYGLDDLADNSIVAYNRHTETWKPGERKRSLFSSIMTKLEALGN